MLKRDYKEFFLKSSPETAKKKKKKVRTFPPNHTVYVYMACLFLNIYPNFDLNLMKSFLLTSQFHLPLMITLSEDSATIIRPLDHYC